jgi:ABC-type transport system involved in cytochrome bd biosynthesis fused ATPase/permease subunit
MKTATALTIAAIGAILAFAVTAHPSFFNFQVAGWVLMLTGVAGALIPRRGYGWLRRRLVLNSGGQRKDIDLRQHHFNRFLVPGGIITEGRDNTAATTPVESETIDQYIPVESENIDQYIAADSENIDQYIEE